MTTATARAHPNIAFIKYWGNRDNALRLPQNSSISMNLDKVYTETTVTWSHEEPTDRLIINGQAQHGEALERVGRHMEMLRKRFGTDMRTVVESNNNFPTGAGIASSASAFAALTAAAVAALGKTVEEAELTTLARLGSGSASRSIPPGYVLWHAAETHEQSYAESVFGPEHWGLNDVIVIINRSHKVVGSSEGHNSANTSDLQSARVQGAAARLERVSRALADRDFATFAQVVELDSNLMHAVMMTSQPPLFYWLPGSLAIMEMVRQLREDGLRVCYTLDAGPNVHCICVKDDAEQVRQAVQHLSYVQDVIVVGAGGGAEVIGQS